MNKHLHIVCLQVPYPPDYGGVIDLFWKLKYLKEQGVSIQLHCFDDDRGAQPELKKYCEAIHYYPRIKGFRSVSLSVPYIVNSRRSSQLLQNLQKDNHPILLEGIHCSFLLSADKLKNRTVVLRLHNNESDYYRQLANNSSNGFRKWYYRIESRLLQKYEPGGIRKATVALSVSQQETVSFNRNGLNNVHYLPVFVPWTSVENLTGKGVYCLYQGNLSVAENERAAIWIINNVFHNINIPLIIAGKNPSGTLKNLINQYPHIQLLENPDSGKMHDLISNAQMNILPSFSETGIKFKLLHALFVGRFCLTNQAMVAGTGLEKACIIADKPAHIVEKITEYMQKDFDDVAQQERQTLLQNFYNNEETTQKLLNWIFGNH